MSNASSGSKVLMYSPPGKKEHRCAPSEYLLLKPFSKAPSLQIEVPRPGESKAVLLSVQNIDENSTRLYFETPADKNITIRPETVVIQPKSVEVFEVIAVEPEESFRAIIKVFAPDIKYYRGGQFSVAVKVPTVIKVEKKKKPKPASSLAKPRAVTVPKEFKFQPSREQRKAGIVENNAEEKENVPQNDFVAELILDDTSSNLETIRRQTTLLKQKIHIDQTYTVAPPKIQTDFNDPITFVKHALGSNCSLDHVTEAVMKYADFAKAQNSKLTHPTNKQIQDMNSILIQNQRALVDGRLSDVMTLMRRKIAPGNSYGEHDTDLTTRFAETHVSERLTVPRTATMATSSPKQGISENAVARQDPDDDTTTLVASESSLLTSPHNGSKNDWNNELKCPDVSVILPLHFNNS